jgi:CRISPR-associated protein Csx16
VAATAEEVRLIVRLISFLGTGNKDGKYLETTYEFESQRLRTNYVAHALAKFNNPQEIHVIATSEAWSLHGQGLSAALSGDQLPSPVQVEVPTGGASEHLWKMFGVIVESIRTSNGPVLLDITHGFRMQPFFAAACIQYVQAVMPTSPPIRVVYGELRGEKETSPIWELTPFLDVLSWSRSLMIFLQTGQADAVVEPTERLARDLSKQWAKSAKKGDQPQLTRLSKALQQFGDDFTTIRTGSLLLGHPSSSRQLACAIEQTQAEVEHHLPALALALDQVTVMVNPLRCDARLSTPAGQRALLALARLYQKIGRYSEAISILREGWITLGAPSAADHPGTVEFDNSERERVDKEWSRKGGHPDPVSEIRNDIQHAGFKRLPHDKKWFREQLDKLLAKWETQIGAEENKSEHSE